MRKASPRRERLVHAAVRLFRRQGYASTGLQQILDESEVPKGPPGVPHDLRGRPIICSADGASQRAVVWCHSVGPPAPVMKSEPSTR